MKSTSKKASTSCVVVPAAMPDIAELVNSAALVFMQLTNDRKTWLAGKKFASPLKRAGKFQDLVHHMVIQLILRKADAILLGCILFNYAVAQDATIWKFVTALPTSSRGLWFFLLTSDF